MVVTIAPYPDCRAAAPSEARVGGANSGVVDQEVQKRGLGNAYATRIVGMALTSISCSACQVS